MNVVLAVLAPFVCMAVMWFGVLVWDVLHAPTDPTWAQGDVSQLDRWDGVDNPQRVTEGAS